MTTHEQSVHATKMANKNDTGVKNIHVPHNEILGDNGEMEHQRQKKTNRSRRARTRASLMRTSEQIKREMMRAVYAIAPSQGREPSNIALGHGDCQVSFRSFTCLQPECLSWWDRLAVQASHPKTPHNEIVRRSTFMLISLLTTGAGMFWSLFYFSLGKRVAASIPLTYSALVCLSLYYGVTEKQYQAFVILHLSLILTFPFIVHMVLGGFQASGGVMFWGFLSPFGAAFFRSAKESMRWFEVYVLLSALILMTEFEIHPLVNTTKPLSATFIKDLFFNMNILGTFIVVFMATHNFAKELEKEYERSEKLLQNILPESISRRIKDGEVPIVDRHEEVTILFADIVGFTSASTRIQPDILIGRFLRDFFASADEIVDARGLEKIKTIGDAYMVVGGLFGQEKEGDSFPPNKSDHAVEVIKLAVEMFDVLEKVNKKHGLDFQIRIGIHSGPVIAGVLGVKKFAYDVWGDAVNTASRMESNGKPGYIHLSQQAYEKVQHLKDHFEFQSCGELQIKGKGKMVTYLAHPIET